MCNFDVFPTCLEGFFIQWHHYIIQRTTIILHLKWPFNYWITNLYSGLSQSYSHSDFFAHKNIWIMSFRKASFQFVQLGWCKTSSMTFLFVRFFGILSTTASNIFIFQMRRARFKLPIQIIVSDGKRKTMKKNTDTLIKNLSDFFLDQRFNILYALVLIIAMSIHLTLEWKRNRECALNVKIKIYGFENVEIKTSETKNHSRACKILPDKKRNNIVYTETITNSFVISTIWWFQLISMQKLIFLYTFLFVVIRETMYWKWIRNWKQHDLINSAD